MNTILFSKLPVSHIYNISCVYICKLENQIIHLWLYQKFPQVPEISFFNSNTTTELEFKHEFGTISCRTILQMSFWFKLQKSLVRKRSWEWGAHLDDFASSLSSFDVVEKDTGFFGPTLLLTTELGKLDCS